MTVQLHDAPKNVLNIAPAAVVKFHNFVFHTTRTEKDLFLNPLFLDPTNQNSNIQLQASVDNMEQATKNHGMANKSVANLQHMLGENIYIFWASF